MISIKEINKKDLFDLAALYEDLSNQNSHIVKMEENYKKIEADQNYILLGAEYNGKIVGSVMGIICVDLVGLCKPFMVIENVIISNAFRRKGIGKKLMLELEKIAQDRNCNYVLFVSGKQRADAHKFYESIGYKPDMVQGFKKFL